MDPATILRRCSNGFMPWHEGEPYRAFARFGDVTVEAEGDTADEAMERAKRELLKKISD